MLGRFEQFTVLMAKINRNIRKIKNQEMADYGLKSHHVSCLYYLSFGPMTSTDLCERCEEDKATISRSLSYLEANGYLTIDSKSAKRYKSPIVLTEKGAELAEKIRVKVDTVLSLVSDVLTDKERIEFYRSLSKINDHLDMIVEKSLNNL